MTITTSQSFKSRPHLYHCLPLNEDSQTLPVSNTYWYIHTLQDASQPALDQQSPVESNHKGSRKKLFTGMADKKKVLNFATTFEPHKTWYELLQHVSLQILHVNQ
jgi:hypothetical protein